MGLISIIKQQKNKWSKSISGFDSDLTTEIDLPNGVTLKHQKKKRNHISNFISSIIKSNYNDSIEETSSKSIALSEKLNKLENNDKVVRFAEDQENSIHEKSSATKKLLYTFNSDSTIVNDESYDSDNTVQDDVSYLKYLSSEVSEYESTIGTVGTVGTVGTIGTVVSDDECDSLSKVFLNRKNITLNGRRDNTLPVLTEYLAEVIRSRLPNLLQEATKWNLMYSMDQHGARLSTLYSLIENQGPCVIVLKNSKHEVFGAFVSEPFKLDHKGFFGTPECFLWKADKYQFKKFNATNLNQYFMLADPTFIAMGGGNGNFGFYLDEDIHYGYSSFCDTFENETLTENKEFEIYGCEVWGFEY